MTKSVEPEKKTGGIEDEFRLDGDNRTIWEAIDDIMRHVPEEVLSRLPADGAEQHDRYLYNSHSETPSQS